MNILQAIILGLVQGLTEFIPVSSSGHLVVLHHVLGVEETGLAFDIALHFGTLVALVMYFWRDLLRLANAVIRREKEACLAWILVAATIPAAVIGYFLESVAEDSFRSPYLVAGTMLVFGLIMLLAERYYRSLPHHDPIEKVTPKQGIAMGFAQALALVPGVSRSGSTITTGLLVGLDRVAATRFSFLLGIPITFGAVIRVFADDSVWTQAVEQSGIFTIGIITALLSGLFAIRFMLRYLAGNGLEVFAYYRIVFAVITFALLSLR